MILFSLAKLDPENNCFLKTSSDFFPILVFAFGSLPCVVEEVFKNTIAACVNVLFIHLRNMTGMARKNFALLLSLIPGGMSTANIQNTIFNQNNTRLCRIYVHAGPQLLV